MYLYCFRVLHRFLQQKDVGGAFGRVITRLCALADNRLPTSLGERRSRRRDHVTIQQQR